MKRIFLVYWIWYIIMMLTIIHVKLTIDYAVPVALIHWLSFAFIGAMPMYVIYIYQENQGKIDMCYLEGCLISFILRSITTCFAIFGLENRWYILCVSGVVMLIFYLTRMRQVIGRI